MGRDVTLEIEQDGVFGHKRQIQLLDNRELRIVEAQKRGDREYSIDLLALDTTSQRRFHLSWRWLSAGIAVLLLTFLALKVLPDFLSVYPDMLSFLVVILGSLLATGCFYLFWKRSSRRQCYFSRHARIPLLELYIGKPSHKEFKHFVEYLDKRIENLREHFKLSDQQQLSGEIRMLRRLSDKKVVSESDYKQAKAKLFARFG